MGVNNNNLWVWLRGDKQSSIWCSLNTPPPPPVPLLLRTLPILTGILLLDRKIRFCGEVISNTPPERFCETALVMPVNHRGPQPWRKCEETLRDLEPVTHEYTQPETGDIFVVKQVVFLRVNHRGPLPLRELHSTDETRVWRDPVGAWACLRLQVNSQCQKLWHRQMAFSETGRSDSHSPRTPPLEGTSLHRRNKSVERPWGILSLFTTCYTWMHPAWGCYRQVTSL